MKRVTAVMAASMALGVFGLVSPAAAGPVSPQSDPADCTTNRIDRSTLSMTCTGRPAGQQWQLWIMLCHSGWVDIDAYGNVVTGNGTSTATCPYQSSASYPRYRAL